MSEAPDNVVAMEARETACKPTVRDTLRSIAAGRLVVSQNGRTGFLEEFDGRKLRDPDDLDRKLIVPGVITLIKAGYLTEFCTVTAAGLVALANGAP